MIEHFSYLTTVYASTDAELIKAVGTYQSGYALEILPDPSGKYRIKVYKKAL